MTQRIPSPVPLSRRHFLAAAAGGAALNRGLGTRRDDREDLEAAERLFGLEFNDEERDQTAPSLERQRQSFEALRAAEVGWNLAPCSTFDPLPAASAPPPTEPGADYTPLEGVATPESDLDLAFATVDELASLLRAKRVTSRRLTELSIARFKKHDPVLHCVITLLEDEALAAADRADREIQAGGWRGPLHGIPYGAKDLFAHRGAKTTFGAMPYKDQVLDFEATVLEKLERAGAVLVAKLTLGALAMGDRWYGERTRNPWNPEQGSSGSSAGSGSAVSAGLVPFALGTETLGSIVSPSTRCSVTGLRPTFGLVSRYGAMPLSWTMDKIGPMARSATDCALVFEAIRGPDGKDPSVRAAAFPWRRNRGVEGIRVGYLDVEGADWQEGDAAAMLSWLKEEGAEPVPVRLPDAPYGALRIMLNAESATAFDELTRSGRARQLVAQGNGSWPNTFRAARFVPAVEYLRASRIRRKLIDDMAEAMAFVDVFLVQGRSQVLTCTNLTGHPTVVVAAGRTEGEQPRMMSLVGSLYGEAPLLAVAEAWQARTGYHRARPRIDA